MRFEPEKTAALPLALAALAGILVCAGCGASRPVSYYSLDATPLPMPAEAPKSDSRLPVALVVGRISASPLYTDNPIVYQVSNVEMETYEYHRWAEVPTEMLETMLTQDLAASGRFRSVTRLGAGTRGDYILRGHLYALDEVDSPSLMARFSLELELVDVRTRSVVWTQTYDHDRAVDQKTVSAVVEALRQDVAEGIDQLSAGLETYLEDSIQR